MLKELAFSIVAVGGVGLTACSSSESTPKISGDGYTITRPSQTVFHISDGGERENANRAIRAIDEACDIESIGSLGRGASHNGLYVVVDDENCFPALPVSPEE